MGASGGSLRNERITAMQDTLNKTFSDDPSYYSNVEVFHKEPLNCRIYDMTSATKGDGRMRIMSEYDRPVLVGDLIHWQKEWWICTHQQNIHDMFWNGVIERCNHLLRWKDENGTIIERHCRAEDATKYTLGVTEQSNNMILPDTRRTVLIPFDEDTVKLSDGRRLIIDKKVDSPKVYKITNVDRVTKMHGENGIILLTCGASQLSPYDNIEYMVADYYTPNTRYMLNILNLPSPFQMKIGQDFAFQIDAAKGNEPLSAAEIEFVSSDPLVATIDKFGMVHGVGAGDCWITAALGDQRIVSMLTVQDLPIAPQYFLRFIDTDSDGEILIGGEKQIDVKLFENSTEIDDFDFTCELIDCNHIAKIKAIKNEAGSHFVVIKATDLLAGVNKTFLVTARDMEHGTEAEIEIKVVGYL